LFNVPQTVLVTGAASGIGYATARHLVNLGCKIIAIDRDADGLARLTEKTAASALRTITCDLSDMANTARAFHEAAEIGYRGAVNCAGIEGRTDYLINQTADDLNKVIDINIKATLNCLREQLRHLVGKEGGAIVNLASIYGLRGQPQWVAYSASKAAVIGMTQGAALEAAQAGVRVNAVAPGPIETPLLARSTGGDYARTASMVPMKRNGQPSEVVSAITWLLSDAAAYVTGIVLPVDGGMVAQTVAQAPAPNVPTINARGT
jgi:NAD(P)-dependent dehydrogenase (short-subunit alcohol dehydrogenase family)